MAPQEIAPTAVACTVCGWRWMTDTSQSTIRCPDCNSSTPACLAADAVEAPELVEAQPIRPPKDE